MKRLHLLTITLLLLLTAAGVGWFLTEQQGQPTASNELTLLEKSNDKYLRHTLGLPKRRSPHGMDELHSSIRTSVGQQAPAYPPAYQAIELAKLQKRKARMRLEGREETIEWIERGPGNVGGRTRAIVPDVADPLNTWFAAGVSGGIWKTTNAGESWENLTPNLANLAVTTMVQAPSNPDVLYAGTGEGMFFNLGGVTGNGVYKSTDRGQTWELLPETVNTREFTNVSRIIVDPEDENHLLAATGGGANQASFFASIMRSRDGGQTWEKIYQPNSFVQQLVADPEDFNTLYACVFLGGVYKSTDGGNNWRSTTLATVAGTLIESEDGSIGRTEIAIAPTNPNRIFASVQLQTVPSSSGIFVSDDKGDSWRIVETTSPPTRDYLGGQGTYNNTLTVNPFDENHMIGGGVDLFEIKVTPGAVRQGAREFLGGFEKDTESFLAFTTVTGFTLWNGRVDSPDIGSARSVEVRFGPGISQMAHRFLACGGDFGAGCTDAEYTYLDYVEVPFQVWDIENNQQLMVSFRDQQNDGTYNLNPRDDANDPDLLTSREYIFIHDIAYDETTPDPRIATTSGHTTEQMYFFWPVLAAGGEWDPENLPVSTFSLLFGRVEFQNSDITPLTNGRNLFSNNTNSNEVIHVDHHFLTTIPIDSETETFRLLNGNDGGVAYSDDGGKTYVETDRNGSGYNTAQFYGVARHPERKLYIGGMQDNGTHISLVPDAQGDGLYEEVFGGDGFETVWSSENPNEILLAAQFNNVVRSRDGGNSVSSVSGLRDSGPTEAPFVTRLSSSRLNPSRVYAVGASGVWVSYNFGLNWGLIEIEDEAWQRTSAMDVTISQANANIVWAGAGMSPNRDFPLSVFLSTNGGREFRKVRNYTLGGFANVLTGIETHPTDPNTAYVLFSQADGPKILRTEDLGQTWEDISGFGVEDESSNGFPDVAVYSLFVLPGDTLWAGTEIGLVESPDNGETWYLADNGLPNVSIWEMKAMPDGELVVATHGRGIWTAQLDLDYTSPADTTGTDDGDDGEVVTSLEDETLPFSLYPNPAKDRLTLELPPAASYQVTLFDLQGRKLQSWKKVAGGQPSLKLQPHPAGTYLLRATDGQQVYTQRVVIRR